jgi:hypothetical protein
MAHCVNPTADNPPNAAPTDAATCPATDPNERTAADA